MNIRQITAHYAVSPQIDPEDVAEIASMGFGTIICNRPDPEIPASHASSVMAQAAADVGLHFVDNPVTHHGLNEAMVKIQRDTQDTSGAPVLAYCASGTRSTIVWALGQAGAMQTDEIIAAAAEGGYDIAGLAPQLDRLAER